VALRCELAALSLPETAAYIAYRIRTAGGDAAKLFTREAVMLIHELSGGIPRTISVVCDNALLGGLAAGRQPVGRDLVSEVARDFDISVPHPPAAFRSEDPRRGDGALLEPMTLEVPGPSMGPSVERELGMSPAETDTRRRLLSLFGS
jgi:hypothetical protein